MYTARECPKHRDCPDVVKFIATATKTLRRLPSPLKRQKVTCWPDYVRNFLDAYGYHATEVRITPTARQISELDQAIDWLTWVQGDMAKIIWARAEGYSWRKIAHMVGLSPNTCRERFRIGVVVIYHGLQTRTLKNHLHNMHKKC